MNTLDHKWIEYMNQYGRPPRLHTLRKWVRQANRQADRKVTKGDKHHANRK
jgi:hypothetical protein